MIETEDRSKLLVDLKHFYGALDLRLRLLQRTRQQLDAQLAPEFSVFHYLNPDELTLSELISDLLSPQGNHGQGATFLSLFLKLIGSPVPTDCARVVREDFTRYGPSSRRRIDITLDFGSSGIGIENKPFADEGENQIADYANHLDRKYKGAYLIVFLSDNGRPPHSISAELLTSLDESRKLVLLSYSVDLAEWLKQCWRECRAERVRWFLQEFQDWIIEEFPLEPGKEDHHGVIK